LFLSIQNRLDEKNIIIYLSTVIIFAVTSRNACNKVRGNDRNCGT